MTEYSTVKRTPAQRIVLKKLRAAGAHGIAVEQIHASTLAGLVRRGDAVVSFGTAYLRADK